MSKCPDERRGECYETRFRVERGKSGENRDGCPEIERDAGEDNVGEVPSASAFRNHDFFKVRNTDPEFRRFGRYFRIGWAGLLSSLLIGGHVYQARMRERYQASRGERESGPGGSADGDGPDGEETRETEVARVADQALRVANEDVPIAVDKVDNISWKVMRGKATHMVAIVEKGRPATDPGCEDGKLEKPRDTISEDVFLKYADPKPRRGAERTDSSHVSSWN